MMASPVPECAAEKVGEFRQVLIAPTPHHPRHQQTTQQTFQVRPLRYAYPTATDIETGEAAW